MIIEFLSRMASGYKRKKMARTGEEPNEPAFRMGKDETYFDVFEEREEPQKKISKEEKAIKALRKIVIQNGGMWNDKFNIVGFQNTKSPGNWNDFFLVHSSDKVYRFVGTTDPGLYYTKKPLNSKGCAHMTRGFHKNCWKLGKHRGKYEALIQTGGKVKVWRDKNKDYINNDSIVESGWFGINFHHGYNATVKIGRNSAGCQVVQNTENLSFIVRLFKGSGLKSCSYTLVGIEELSHEIKLGAIYR